MIKGFALWLGQRLGYQGLNGEVAVDIFLIPDVFPVALAVFGNDVSSPVLVFPADDAHIAQLSHLHVHNRFPKRRDGLQLFPYVKHADDFSAPVRDGFIGGQIPGVDDIGESPIGLSLQDRRRHRVDFSVRQKVWNVGADGPAMVQILHVGCHPQHVAAFIHTLKNSAGDADETLYVIDHGRGR